MKWRFIQLAAWQRAECGLRRFMQLREVSRGQCGRELSQKSGSSFAKFIQTSSWTMQATRLQLEELNSRLFFPNFS